MTKEISDTIPWVCHICQGQFDTHDGGICFRCTEPSCSRHLRHLVDTAQEEGAHEPEFLCTNCIKDNEETESIREWKARVLKRRRIP